MVDWLVKVEATDGGGSDGNISCGMMPQCRSAQLWTCWWSRKVLGRSFGQSRAGDVGFARRPSRARAGADSVAAVELRTPSGDQFEPLCRNKLIIIPSNTRLFYYLIHSLGLLLLLSANQVVHQHHSLSPTIVGTGCCSPPRPSHFRFSTHHELVVQIDHDLSLQHFTRAAYGRACASDRKSAVATYACPERRTVRTGCDRGALIQTSPSWPKGDFPHALKCFPLTLFRPSRNHRAEGAGAGQLGGAS